MVMPEPPVPAHVPSIIRKHPPVSAMPLEKVEVEAGVRLINEAPDWSESRVPGEVVPTPRLPVSMNLPASVSIPDLRVEKIRSALPPK